MNDKKESKHIVDYISLVVAIVALVLSFWSFYQSSFQVLHSLQVSLPGSHIALYFNEKSTDLETEIILLNRGNQSEVIIDLTFSFVNTKDYVSCNLNGHLNGSERQAAHSKNMIIIDKGDVETIKHNIKVKGLEDGFYVSKVEFRFLDANGFHSYRSIGYASIEIENGRIAKEYKETSVYDLFSSNSVVDTKLGAGCENT